MLMTQSICHIAPPTAGIQNSQSKRFTPIKATLGKPNRDFLAMNNIADGIMRKNTTTAKFTRLNMLRICWRVCNQDA